MSRKITDLIKNEERFSFSFEVTPDITKDELDNLKLEPLFFSITWHAQTHKCKGLNISPLKLAERLRNRGKDVLLHLSCNMLTKEYVGTLINTLQNLDICNLFIILGESFDPKSTDFQSTKDLIKFIRLQTGDYFCIGVAGFPGRDDKLEALKEKIDSGADFILTQAFFEYDLFKAFLEKCIALDITVPVIPGIFPFETESELTGFVNMCKVHVSEDFKGSLKNENGISLVSKMLKSMISDEHINHFHFFTLNKLLRINNLITKIHEIMK